MYMNRPLIEISDELLATDSFRPLSDAAFVVADNKHLILAGSGIEKQAFAYLDHSITRKPLDLRAHTQRIYLNLTNNDNAGVYAALLDLFVSLGERGKSLRRHMLQRCSRILTQDQIQLFQVHLERSISSTTTIPDPGNSLLLKGLESSLPLISKAEVTSSEHPIHPLKEAQAYLEYGQLEEATLTLEKALLGDPNDHTLISELLDIYIHAGLIERYHAQTKAMKDAGHVLSPAWVSAEKQLG